MTTLVAPPPEIKAPPEVKPAPRPTEVKVAEELAKIPFEPFLPVERHLVTWSLVLGAVLLVALVWASYAFFPG